MAYLTQTQIRKLMEEKKKESIEILKKKLKEAGPIYTSKTHAYVRDSIIDYRYYLKYLKGLLTIEKGEQTNERE